MYGFKSLRPLGVLLCLYWQTYLHFIGVFLSVFLQHWPVFTNVSEVVILVPPLLGLKGNLEMTLASRLSTQVGTNQNRSVYGMY